MDKLLETIINSIKQIIMTIIYIVIVYIYTDNLKQLNYELLEKEKIGWTAINLIQYNDYQALYYFFYAITLMLIGMGIIYFTFSELKKYYTDIKDIILGIVIIIIILLIIIHIFKLITIPILKIIFTVVTIGLGLLFAISSNN